MSSLHGTEPGKAVVPSRLWSAKTSCGYSLEESRVAEGSTFALQIGIWFGSLESEPASGGDGDDRRS
jgi:hypothetical protein